MRFDKELDVRDARCPLHVLRLRKAITQMNHGEVLRIRARDPESLKDFRKFSDQTGNRLLSFRAAGMEFVFFLRKA
jgi:tRNA 2-thiouridine synthesizing protein A